MIEYKTPDQLKQMRLAGRVVATGLAAMKQAAKPGVTTAELDAVGREVLASHGATSSFLNYGAEYGPGFAGVACVSVNDEIVHGVPGDRVIAEGDLVSCDFGAIVNGWHGDAAVSFIVGEGKSEHQKLVDDTRDVLWAGIAAAKLGNRIGEISAAIQSRVRQLRAGYGIVREYTGHGIGSQMHMEPDVPNYGRRLSGPKLEVGMAIAIEPMLVLGDRRTDVLEDEWTVVTRDGNWGAHWEHTITVTKSGIWVLTAEDGGEEDLNKLGLRFGPLAD
ncbi:MAG: type I methionyl aminopeptidase [Propionibacterium sp.]|nr:MAG: type I methionyl aminopeptidase [Propionibacterium sp.]